MELFRKNRLKCWICGLKEESHSSWCSQIVLVGKKDLEGSIRFCVGFCKVNEVPHFDLCHLIPPKIKKEMRFLGLAGNYWQFVPGFAELISPLTDLTRKSAPDMVRWPGGVRADLPVVYISQKLSEWEARYSTVERMSGHPVGGWLSIITSWAHPAVVAPSHE